MVQEVAQVAEVKNFIEDSFPPFNVKLGKHKKAPALPKSGPVEMSADVPKLPVKPVLPQAVGESQSATLDAGDWKHACWQR